MKTVLALILLSVAPLCAQNSPLHAKVKLSCVSVVDSDAQIGKVTVHKGVVVPLTEGSVYQVAEIRGPEIILRLSEMNLRLWKDQVETFRPQPKLEEKGPEPTTVASVQPTPIPQGIDLNETRPAPKPVPTQADLLAEQNRLLRQKFNDDVETLRNLQLQRPDLYGPVQRYYPAY